MDIIDLYALNMIPGLGKKSLLNIIQSGVTISDLMSMDIDAIGGYVKGAGKKAAYEALSSHFIEYQDRAEDILNEMRKNGIEIIVYSDSLYPSLYTKISDPPAFLFAKGNVQLLNKRKSLAIIGTRECSEFGKQIAFNTADYFANRDFNIVSGLALGIDTAGHKGALSANGKTTAILTDIDKIYPKENIKLAEDILANEGLLIAENPPGTYPNRGLFVSRDRLQSALSLAVFPIETDIKGGTMHTVRFSEEQGRPLFCPDLSKISKYPNNFAKSRGIIELINTNRAKAYSRSNYDEISALLKKSEEFLWDMIEEPEGSSASEQMSLGIF
jgi:DNA processing protein